MPGLDTVQDKAIRQIKQQTYHMRRGSSCTPGWISSSHQNLVPRGLSAAAAAADCASQCPSSGLCSSAREMRSFWMLCEQIRLWRQPCLLGVRCQVLGRRPMDSWINVQTRSRDRAWPRAREGLEVRTSYWRHASDLHARQSRVRRHQEGGQVSRRLARVGPPLKMLSACRRTVVREGRRERAGVECEHMECSPRRTPPLTAQCKGGVQVGGPSAVPRGGYGESMAVGSIAARLPCFASMLPRSGWPHPPTRHTTTTSCRPSALHAARSQASAARLWPRPASRQLRASRMPSSAHWMVFCLRSTARLRAMRPPQGALERFGIVKVENHPKLLWPPLWLRMPLWARLSSESRQPRWTASATG